MGGALGTGDISTNSPLGAGGASTGMGAGSGKAAAAGVGAMRGAAAAAGVSDAGSAVLSCEAGPLVSRPRDAACDGHSSERDAAVSCRASCAGDAGSCGINGAGAGALCGKKLATLDGSGALGVGSAMLGVGSGTLGAGSTMLGFGSGYCGDAATFGGGSTLLGVGSAGGRLHNGWAGGAAGFSIAGGSTAGAPLRICGAAGGALADATSRYACAGVLGRTCDEAVDTAHSRVKEVFSSVSGFSVSVSALSRSFVRLLTSARISETGRRACTSSEKTRLTPS